MCSLSLQQLANQWLLSWRWRLCVSIAFHGLFAYNLIQIPLNPWEHPQYPVAMNKSSLRMKRKTSFLLLSMYFHLIISCIPFGCCTTGNHKQWFPPHLLHTTCDSEDFHYIALSYLFPGWEIPLYSYLLLHKSCFSVYSCSTLRLGMSELGDQNHRQFSGCSSLHIYWAAEQATFYMQSHVCFWSPRAQIYIF